jgi:hypothetical protein
MRRRRKQRGLRGGTNYHRAQAYEALRGLRRAINDLEKAKPCSKRAFNSTREGWLLVGEIDEHLMPRSKSDSDQISDLGDLQRDLSRLQFRKIKACNV